MLACGLDTFTDYLKTPMSLGWTLSNLVLGCLEFKPVFVAANQWDVALNVIEWGAGWMTKAHAVASNTPSGNTFVGQVCNHVMHHMFVSL